MKNLMLAAQKNIRKKKDSRGRHDKAYRERLRAGRRELCNHFCILIESAPIVEKLITTMSSSPMMERVGHVELSTISAFSPGVIMLAAFIAIWHIVATMLSFIVKKDSTTLRSNVQPSNQNTSLQSPLPSSKEPPDPSDSTFENSLGL